MATNKVSKALITRLPRYLEHLKQIPQENGAYISSASVADALGLGHVLVRKDFAKISNGGHPKTGYLRRQLIVDLESFLGYHNTMDAILVGTGKLGSALLDYPGFLDYGINVLAGFDLHPDRSDTEQGKPIHPLETLGTFCQENGVCMGIITVPAVAAQTVCDQMVACGIRAIWNFAPVHLDVPDSIHVHNENLAVSLTELRMQLKMIES